MLNSIKTLLGIDAADTSKDEMLKIIVESVLARLKLLLGGVDPPEAMEHIIIEVAIIRFNRIGSEGMASHTVEGESFSFVDSDFNGFADEIQAFLESQKESARGRVRFL